MKELIFNQLLILSLILMSQKAFGQNPTIDSLKIIPENANTNDEIKVICYTTFPSGGCELVNHSLIAQGNQLTLSLEYEFGFLTYICHSVDTISLGNLDANNYQLHVNLIIHPMDQIVDSDNVNFSIDTPLSINSHSTKYSLTVFPNPFENELQIKTDATIEKVELSTFSGQKIILKEITVPNDTMIDVSELKNGIYLLTITDNKGNKYTKRIVKNNQ
ncbi:T9SS type A sorting domain-containing protein [Fluviicola taffensis]|uniref:Secretion system C-terminal sorting domain-containing protein n=1 Tax=Fluviicola taffensis (strain DSM 16823 / NCIMB 13979 / RW262) TaxID=755732 RepID=F2IDR5_FLUTR|nr:T9SS type A sorting domain-containing protein [Fluviicola taffensis]AEA44457.1 hypothetical protein Fluta_2472 [Fluviicola taffensis DSM 16823]